MLIRPSLPAEQLRATCSAEHLNFETTAELADLDDALGQERAVEALEFGVSIQRSGFNMFALGPVGMGKHHFVKRYLGEWARKGATPQDISYVYNFDKPEEPRALLLPAGRAEKLRKEMEALVEDLRSAIRTAFESPDYRTDKQTIEDAFKDRQDEALKGVEKQAKERGIAVLRTEEGIALAPMGEDGEVLDFDEFDELPEAEQAEIDQAIDELRRELNVALRDAPRWERETRSKLRSLKRDVTAYAVGHLFDDLEEGYRDLPAVVDYLEAVLNDVVERAADLRDGILEEEESEPAIFLGGGPPRKGLELKRYQINVLVDHRGTEGMPVVYEDHPTVRNLIGHVERRAEFGVVVTDYSMIRPGALHRAHGGFLILDAAKLLSQPLSWDVLKRALRSRELRITQGEDPATGAPVGDASLEPETIPLEVKVVLVGERILHYLLTEADPDFAELFKVSVDFEDEIDRTPEGVSAYAQMLATLIRQDELRHLDRAAVARVIEHSARLSGDAHRLTTHIRSMIDLLREADWQAGRAGASLVGEVHVKAAVEAQERRDGRLREQSLREFADGTLLLDTDGVRVGQINGLSVLSFGRVSFGRPTRITARVRVGRGEVLDIEREIELGGPIHTKGVLILTGFLGSRYASEQPLSLSASVVFEQSYSGVDGDSASLAETCALISALAEQPIDQSLAVTGAMNQHGAVQAIGGVNEKIEGFFDLCASRGLTGRQGVLIPRSNVRHLMLRDDVVEAVREGHFHIWPVATVDEAAELLMHVPAGLRDERGGFPAGTLNRAVQDRLEAMAEQARRYHGRG